MNTVIILLTSTFLSFLCYGLLKRFDFFKQKDDIYTFSFSYLALFGIITVQMFLYVVLRIQMNTYSLLIPWILVFGFLFVLYRKDSFIFKLTNIRFSAFDKCLLTMIVLLLIFTGFESVIRPVSAWDAWSNWLLKAKIFYIENDIAPMFDYVKSDYPIGISLFVTFFYFIIGKLDDASILILFFQFYFFLSVVFFSYIRQFTNNTIALLFTFLLISSQNIIRHGGRFEAGQADLALGYAILCCSVVLVDFLRFKEFKSFIIVELFASICGFIKYEGLVFSAIVQLTLLFVVIRGRKFTYLPGFLPWAIFTGAWMVYKNSHNVISHYIFSDPRFHTERVFFVLSEMAKEFLNIKNWNLLWVVFIIAIIVCFKRKNFIFLPFFVIVLLQWTSYFLTYLVSPISSSEQVPSTIDRLYLHLAPLATLFSSLVISSTLNFKKIPLISRLTK